MILRELINLIGFEIDQGAMKNVEEKTSSMFNRMKSVGEEMSLKVTAPIMAAAGLAVHEFTKWNVAMAEVRQRVVSTGGAAGKTVEELDQMSRSLAEGVDYSHESILEAEAELLKFKDISGNTFDVATKAAIDLAASMKISVAEAARMLGRSLLAPGEMMRTLTLAGVHLTTQEKKRLELLTQSGRAAEAQNYILTRLQDTLGGTARAVSGAGSGFNQFKKSLNDLAESFGEVLQPAFKKFYDIVSKLLDWFRKIPKETKQTIAVFAGIAAAIGPVNTIAGMLGPVISVLIAAFGWWIPIIIAVTAALFLLTEDFLHFIHGGKSFIGQFIEPWKTLAPKIKEYVQPIIYWFTEAWQGLVQFVKGIVQLIGALIGGKTAMGAAAIRNLVTGLARFIFGLLFGLVDVVFAILQIILFKIIPSFIKMLLLAARNLVKEIGTIIYTALSDSIQWVRDLILKIPGMKKVMEAWNSQREQAGTNVAYQEPSWKKNQPEAGWGSIANSSLTNNSSKVVHVSAPNSVVIHAKNADAKDVAAEVNKQITHHTRQMVIQFAH